MRLASVCYGYLHQVRGSGAAILSHVWALPLQCNTGVRPLYIHSMDALFFIPLRSLG